MKQLDIFQNEKTQDISNSIESCIISFQEGASDDKSMSINWLESFKEKNGRKNIYIHIFRIL